MNNTQQIIIPSFQCEHLEWTARLIPLSNGRPTLREFCTQCGSSSGGSNLGFSLPMVSDVELTVSSFKHKNRTLLEIKEIDPEYLVWIVTESKSSDRIKKASARVYFGEPYYTPEPGSVYSSEKNMITALENAQKFIESLTCTKQNKQ